MTQTTTTPPSSALTRLRDRLLLQEDLNFLLTNRVPRLALTRFMGWFSQIENPVVRAASIAAWRACTEIDLSDAQQQRFKSLHAMFTRALKPGARPVAMDPDVLASPCDGIVGACGPVDGTRLFQAKGFPYEIGELFGDEESARPWHGGQYVTLRLTSAMYHRFHAPHDCTVERLTYLSGDTWNVNPIALKRVERLFCRNERAVLHTRLAGGHPVALVPVAAILVASIRLHFMDTLLHLRSLGAKPVDCAERFAKGQEMGWFEHGSTIIVFAPEGFALAEGIAEGARIRMGQALMRLPPGPAAPV
ncbi:archaetidylserine decarboxylase [Pseudorhodoferax sp. Leaf265]|uniref:archaetidylserine decarboxylase n=1 Tax=Pseudorhodoferax sp. Leaf265 TaxID=1736315 RepID=UPI0006F3C758|nr:archaetidylserine decarboxylase [Pseudorhodoferax sp. Leaf265]KQP18723.1 phosphatidylserine decarboxylase [Pseudorhodoferax sp. Leaf265]